MALRLGNGLNLQNRPIDNVADPASAQQAATKNYVDGVVRGLDWKSEVVAASTGNVSLAAPGTALDGVTLAAGDRVLLKDQTAPAENGIWVWTAAGSALTRALDADSGPELSGATVTVQRGTVNADRVYRVLTDDPITLGTTGITLGQVGGGGGTTYTAGNGLTLTATDFNVGAGAGINVTADAVAVDTAVVTRKVTGTLGTNGSLTSVAVTHNLGSRHVHAVLRDAATFEEVITDNVATDLNTVTFTFATAPAAGAFIYAIVG